MTERERFSAYILEKYNSDVVWHEGNPIKAMDLMLWQTWQAATQREGFKFVPVENIESIYTACNNALDINDVDIYKGLAMAIIDDCEDMIGTIDDH